MSAHLHQRATDRCLHAQELKAESVHSNMSLSHLDENRHSNVVITSNLEVTFHTITVTNKSSIVHCNQINLMYLLAFAGVPTACVVAHRHSASSNPQIVRAHLHGGGEPDSRPVHEGRGRRWRSHHAERHQEEETGGGGHCSSFRKFVALRRVRVIELHCIGSLWSCLCSQWPGETWRTAMT